MGRSIFYNIEIYTAIRNNPEINHKELVDKTRNGQSTLDHQIKFLIAKGLKKTGGYVID